MATIIICFLPLSFMNPSTPVAFFVVALTFTRISETCRAVSITPYAQTTRSPKDLGIGTSLVTFFNSMASLIATAVNGLIFDSDVSSVNKAIN